MRVFFIPLVGMGKGMSIYKDLPVTTYGNDIEWTVKAVYRTNLLGILRRGKELLNIVIYILLSCSFDNFT